MSPWELFKRTSAQRRATILQMWNEGASLKEIAQALDSTPGSVSVSISRMRAKGYELPYRRANIGESGQERVADE